MPTQWRQFLVYITLNVAALVGLIYYANQIADINYQDHLRSCIAQNEGRVLANQGRKANADGWIRAARKNEAVARLTENPIIRRENLNAAAAYRQDAAAQAPVPLFDCNEVVKKAGW